MAQINKSTDYFSANIWVADDTSPRSLTGFGHQPDMVWTKHRGSANCYHTITDSVRGGDKMIAPNDISAEDTKSHGEITSFDSDGITVADGTSGTYPRLYFNDFDPFGVDGGNYVGWSWKAGGTASSNTDGSITSSVSANTTAGFSIVSYSGNSTGGATIGHGLGTTPAMFIIKNRSAGEHWVVYHQSISPSNMLYLNLTNAQDPANQFNSTAPTSSVFSVSSNIMVNASSNNYIAYCFAEKKGFSKFGSYTGNGSTDGTFVYTGFKPAWLMVKRTTNIGGWLIYDNKRDSYNVTDLFLYADTADADTAFTGYDFLSNGFKTRTTGTGMNSSGDTFIYMAFAENPLVGTNNIPATAR